MAVLTLLFLTGAALAFPHRGDPLQIQEISWAPGLTSDVLVVKLSEGRGLSFDGRVQGPGSLDGLDALLTDAEPLFRRDPEAIRSDRSRVDPDGDLADLNLYLRVRGPDVLQLGDTLNRHPLVEVAYLAYAPVPPPVDLPPVTPDFEGEQGYLDGPPDGLGVSVAREWLGGWGENVALADLEYSWDATHEDLSATLGAASWGWDSGYYAFHGNMVLGELFAGDDGYGVTGIVPEAEPLVISPYDDNGDYNVAAAIDGAAAMLEWGDVLLIEQQALAHDSYCPVEIDPAVFDAISLAVAKGIVVVEPTGNGAQDLDDPIWDGWFDREQRDSGAIMVGGGSSPSSGLDPRTWPDSGSCYGSRVDLQGWYDGVATTANDEYGGYYADLFFPAGDGRQAYTSIFSGTSAAAPMVAGAAALANSVAWETWGEPWDPAELRAALVSTGTPQPSDDDRHLGPQPNLEVFFRTWGVR